jgi:triosephosphate isomerase (TIM)
MSERTPLLAANWKMHKTRAEAAQFLDAFLPRAAELEGVDLVVCPSSTAVATAAERCAGSPVRVAGQNMHQEADGAFTGEVSAGMLLEAGAWGTILGHSERRQLFGETDEALSAKVPAALRAGLVPILCVGETEEQRDAGETEAVLRRQVEADLSDVSLEELGNVVIAYEPVWAIGTGRTATVEQAREAIDVIRELVGTRDASALERVRILYGGSVKPANAEELLEPETIDGALVGGASLDPDDFFAICTAARP